mgnify:FL=1
MASDRLYKAILKENDISKIILNACIKVHKELGPGLLESAYEACLEYELKKEGLDVRKQVSLPLQYNNVFIDCAYIADMIINDLVIVEIKAVKKLDDIHMAQILSYLRISRLRLGLLVNFNETTLIKGYKRVVNGLENNECEESF